MIKQIYLDSDLPNLNLPGGLPDRSFPQKVEYKADGVRLLGYFANYDGQVNQQDLLALFTQNKLSSLVNSNSDFLLFHHDSVKRRLLIVLDQSNSIPCFFFSLGGRQVVSTKFATVLQEIKKTTKPNLDLDGLISWLLWEWHATEKSLFKEIKVIPPGCVVDINLVTGKFTIKSLVDLQGFLISTDNKYTNPAIFAQDWLKMMQQVVGDRVKLATGKKITSDLSSGFDCTLVAYSLHTILGDSLICNSKVSDVTKEETDINLMKQFASLHNIKLDTSDTTVFDLHQQDFSKDWRDDDPFQIKVTGFENYLKILADKRINIQFTGEGGDESYSASEMDLPESFPVQNSFFINVMYLKKMGLERLFTKEIVNFALSKDRFESRTEYPMIAPASSAIPSASTSWSVWEKDLWMMNPFYDTRMIALARRMPESIKGLKQDRKFSVLSNLTDVFPKEMFINKSGREKAFLGFAKKQKRLVLDVLENSVLGKLGIINKDNILKMVNDEKSELDDPEFAIVFQTIIQLDWFLQKNLN